MRMKFVALSFAVLALLLAPAVKAAPLDVGFAGVAWGTPIPFPAPWEGCIKQPEPGVEWACPLDKRTVMTAEGVKVNPFGEIPFKANYMAEDGIVYGVLIMGKSFLPCDNLYRVLLAAYGPIDKKYSTDTSLLPDGSWRSTDGIAVWDYNPVSTQCQVSIFSVPIIQAQREKREKAAKEAAMGL